MVVVQVEARAQDLLPGVRAGREVQERAGHRGAAVVGAELEVGRRRLVGGHALLHEGVERGAQLHRRVDGHRELRARVREERRVRGEHQLGVGSLAAQLHRHRRPVQVLLGGLVERGVPHHRGGDVDGRLARGVQQLDRAVRLRRDGHSGGVQRQRQRPGLGHRGAVLDDQELLETGTGGLQDQVHARAGVDVGGLAALQLRPGQLAQPAELHLLPGRSDLHQLTLDRSGLPAAGEAGVLGAAARAAPREAREASSEPGPVALGAPDGLVAEGLAAVGAADVGAEAGCAARRRAGYGGRGRGARGGCGRYRARGGRYGDGGGAGQLVADRHAGCPRRRRPDPPGAPSGRRSRPGSARAWCPPGPTPRLPSSAPGRSPGSGSGSRPGSPTG